MDDLSFSDRSYVIAGNRDYGNGLPVQRYELQFVAAGWMHEDDCADVAAFQPVIREVAFKNRAFMFAKFFS